MSKINAVEPPSKGALFITGIRVDRLFGQYSYDLKPEATGDALSRLLILYGENGTGKTTLLWLVFHLLSREPSRGHRTFLAKSRFRRLAVSLGNGAEPVAERQSTSLTGPFEMSYILGSQRYSYHYGTNEKGTVPNLAEDQFHSDFIQILPDLNMKFLADDRKISTDLDLESENDKPIVYWDESLVHAMGVHRLFPRLPQQVSQPSVQRWETALDRVVQWVREQALRASNQGQLDFNAIYSDIVRRVGQPAGRKVPKHKTEDLVTMLRLQAERNHEYAKFGLTSDLRVTDLVHSISKVDKRRLTVINQILRPYVEGNEARLRALASLQRSIQTFVDSINDFYVNKHVTFDVREGFKIYVGNEVTSPCLRFRQAKNSC